MDTTEKTLKTSKSDNNAASIVSVRPPTYIPRADTMSTAVEPPTYDYVVTHPNRARRSRPQTLLTFTPEDFVKNSFPERLTVTVSEPGNTDVIIPKWRPFPPSLLIIFFPGPVLIIYLIRLGYSYAHAQRLAYKWRHGKLDINEVPEAWKGGESKRRRF